MGRIDVGQYGFFQQSSNTKFEIAREATRESIDAVLRKLASSSSLAKDRVCYVHGKGGKPKDSYAALRQRPGVEVVYLRSLLPRFARFMQFAVASYEGLVRIDDLARLPRVFTELMNLSAVGVYCVRAAFEGDLVRLASRPGRLRQIDLGVKADSSYAYYIVDADNAESRTGMIEIVSHGFDTPLDMIPISSDGPSADGT